MADTWYSFNSNLSIVHHITTIFTPNTHDQSDTVSKIKKTIQPRKSNEKKANLKKNQIQNKVKHTMQKIATCFGVAIES